VNAPAPLCILVVDDDRLVRSAMVRTLKRVPGTTVHDFGDGASALESLEGKAFDVAVLDLKMPGMDGVELATHLRAKLPGLRIIFVSADPHGDLAQRARKLGPAGVLAKPWTPDELVRLLRP
jgi:CheY-like chemotaxis protein